MKKRILTRLIVLACASVLTLPSCSTVLSLESYSFTGISETTYTPESSDSPTSRMPASISFEEDSSSSEEESDYFSSNPFSSSSDASSESSSSNSDASSSSYSSSSEEPISSSSSSSSASSASSSSASTSSEPSASSSQPSSSSSSSPSSSSPSSSSEGPTVPVTPDNVEYAITDLPSMFELENLDLSYDHDSFYASLAASLAKNEIASFGYETFYAYALVPDETGQGNDLFIPGIAFTLNELFGTENGLSLYSSGFMQLLDKSGEPPKHRLVGEDEIAGVNDYSYQPVIANEGVFVLPMTTSDTRRFVLSVNIWVDGFAGIYEEKYFSYRQSGEFAITIDVKDAKGELADYADDDLDIYSYDLGEYVYKGSLFRRNNAISAYAIYNSRAKQAYENALAMIDYIIGLQDQYNGQKMEFGLNNIIVFDPHLLDAMATKQQRAAINGILVETLENRELKPNEYIVIGEEYGKAYVEVKRDNNYKDLNRMTSGLLRTLTALGVLAFTVGSLVMTGGTSLPWTLVGIKMFFGLTAMTYGASELDLGLQDMIRGYNGDDTPSENRITEKLGEWFGDKAMDVYHWTGIISSVGVSCFGSIDKAFSQALARGGTGAQIFADVTQKIVRITLFQIAKIYVTEKVGKLAQEITETACQKIGLNDNISKMLGYFTRVGISILVYRSFDKLDQALNITGVHRANIIEGDGAKQARQGDSEGGSQSGGQGSQGSGGSSGNGNKGGSGGLNEIRSHYDDVGDIDIGGSAENFPERTPTGKEAALREAYSQTRAESYVTNRTEVKIFSETEMGGGLEMAFNPRIASKNFTKSFASGCYDPNTGTIYVSSHVLENQSYEGLRTMAHLMRHAYQIQYAKFGSPVEVSLRKGNYVPGDVSQASYSNNPAEMDAEGYADYYMERVMRAIYVHQVQNGKIAIKTEEEQANYEKQLALVEHPPKYPDPITFKEAKA